MKLKIVFLFFLFCCLQSFAQYKHMLHKPYEDKVEDIHELYEYVFDKGLQDSLFVKNYTKEIRKFALKNNDKDLVLEADLLLAYYYVSTYYVERPHLISSLIAIAEKGQKEGVLHIEARAVNAIATYYWYTKQFEKSFEWSIQSVKILNQMSPEDFSNMATHLNFIGKCYYHFNDYNEALTYFKKASVLPKTEFNYLAVIEAQNTLGLCYQKLGNLDLSDTSFLSIINDSSQYKSPLWVGIASGNLGYNHYLRGDYKKAIPLFEIDIHSALKRQDYGLAAGSTIPLADIFLKQNKLDASKQKIEESKAYILKSYQYDRYRDLYPIVSKWFAVNKQADSSTIYLDLALKAVKEYNDEYNALTLVRANQKAQAKERELEIERLNAKSKLKLSQRNYIIFFIGVLLVVSVLMYWFRNKFLLKEQEIKALKIEKTERALAQAKNQLQNLKAKIHNEQQIIESLQQELQTNGNKKMVNELKSKIIITDEDWNKYQRLFEEAYPAYIQTLRSTYIDLTPSELRCLCLEKLELSNKEMGLVLGVSTNSVMVTKHRIRKKLDLKNQQELQKLVRKIG